jgi:hypothetical protein
MLIFIDVIRLTYEYKDDSLHCLPSQHAVCQLAQSWQLADGANSWQMRTLAHCAGKMHTSCSGKTAVLLRT